jgi:hypothetical protein
MPGCDDELFHKLWLDGLLRFNQESQRVDDVDSTNARLVCATLRKRSRLIILLPDREPRRSALLFATAILRHWFDHKELSIGQSRPVVYFGSAIGIREQLGHVKLSGNKLTLADIFTQRDVSRGRSDLPRTGPGISTEDLLKSRLPEVITVYSPIDPAYLLRSIKPAWVAIDIGDSGTLPWLAPLLSYSVQASIPVVAWGSNPLSENLSIASRHARVFVWPFKPAPQLFTGSAATTTELADHLETVARHVEPLVLAGKATETLGPLIEKAFRRLASVQRESGEKLLSDAVAVHWWLLRAMEGLCVPADLHDAEANKTWGLRPLGRLKDSCERFRDAVKVSYPQVGAALADIGADLDSAVDWVRSHDPPLWTALCNLCLETQAFGTARLLVFPSDARKRLFQFALLARYNIADDDLAELGTWIMSARELRSYTGAVPSSGNDSPLRGPPPLLERNPMVVGLPSIRASYTMDCLLDVKRVEYLIFSHQVQGLRRRLHDWSQWLAPDPASRTNLLSVLSGVRSPHVLEAAQPSFVIDPPRVIEVESLERRSSERLQRLVTLDDPATEVAALFDATSDEGEEAYVVSDRAEPEGGHVLADEDLCSEAVFLEFDQGWRGLFALDDTVNLIVSAGLGRATEERFVRSLRRGDRVLLIQGSRRQSLYDLIVERVHKHPAIELHLALIRRWQDDLRLAVHRLHPGNTIGESSTLDHLLKELITRGSRLTSSATLYHWLQGWTLCPQDPEDIRRSAETLNMVFILKNYRSVARAANRVRGLHRSLSLRLGRWLSDQATTANERRSDDVLDEELGLTFEDFRNSVLVVKVLEATIRPGPFLRGSLGRVFTDSHT